ncbi:YjgN family protein [Nitrospinota bacterium]
MRIPPAAGHSATRMHHHGQLGDLFLIHVINILLKWVTLNIYHFWGKTRIREYLWSHQGFEGDRFEYTGRGKELFIGFLKAALAMVALIILAAFLYGRVGPSMNPSFVLATLVIFATAQFLMALAGYSARGYLLTRTRWRSIRFFQTGSPPEYAVQAVGHGLLVILTLGLYWPFRRHVLLRYKINNTWFGTEKFAYGGTGKDLFGFFVLSYLLTIPTLGLIWFWYLARDAAYVASRTRLGALRFTLGYTGGQLLWLRLSNFVLSIVTLGLGYPWVTLRNVRFLFEHLRLQGELDYERILQRQEEMPRSGEGLAEIFGVSGTFLGLGRI